MALITLAGFPAAGKSTRTAQLVDVLTARIADPDYQGPIQKVVIVSDDSLGLTRECYDGRVLHTFAVQALMSQRASWKSRHGGHCSLLYSGSWEATPSSLWIR